MSARGLARGMTCDVVASSPFRSRVSRRAVRGASGTRLARPPRKPPLVVAAPCALAALVGGGRASDPLQSLFGTQGRLRPPRVDRRRPRAVLAVQVGLQNVAFGLPLARLPGPSPRGPGLRPSNARGPPPSGPLLPGIAVSRWPGWTSLCSCHEYSCRTLLFGLRSLEGRGWNTPSGRSSPPLRASSSLAPARLALAIRRRSLSLRFRPHPRAWPTFCLAALVAEPLRAGGSVPFVGSWLPSPAPWSDPLPPPLRRPSRGEPCQSCRDLAART